MIRAMTKQDLPAVRTLMESIPRFWHEIWTDATLEQGLASAGELALVYEMDGRVVGMAFCHDCGFRAYLSELAVEESLRGKGIGKALMERLEEILAERKCELIMLDALKTAEEFYRKLGYSEPEIVTLLRKRL